MADMLCEQTLDTSRSPQRALLKFIPSLQKWWRISDWTSCTDIDVEMQRPRRILFPYVECTQTDDLRGPPWASHVRMGCCVCLHVCNTRHLGQLEGHSCALLAQLWSFSCRLRNRPERTGLAQTHSLSAWMCERAGCIQGGGRAAIPDGVSALVCSARASVCMTKLMHLHTSPHSASPTQTCVHAAFAKARGDRVYVNVVLQVGLWFWIIMLLKHLMHV